MEIDVLKKIIKNNLNKFEQRNSQIRKARKYYVNENDIMLDSDPINQQYDEQNKNALRQADNRVSHNWHRLLVNQKAAYMMSEPPRFDANDKHLNSEITKLLGDSFSKIAKDLCVDASNGGISWVHVWRDEDNNFFKYGIIDSTQIIPIFSKRLDKKLQGILRVYDDYDEKGDLITVYEYWNDNDCQAFQKKKGNNIEDIETFEMFGEMDIATGQPIGKTNTYKHGWSNIPFIPFRNSADELSDLKMYKGLVDVYDKVYSDFVNDLDDIQEIIFVLTNYGGEDKQEFLDDLKKYKMVKVDDDGSGDRGGVDTIAVDIPTEARDKLLEVTREAIFVNGQGVDPQRSIGQNNSGAAIKYMYSLLELKASATETEFRQGFGQLIRFILEYSNSDADIEIKQTWKRTSINNDLEIAQILASLAPITSNEAIAKANPLVENWEDELTKQAEELLDDNRMEDDYKPTNKDVTEDAEEGGA
ncbi:phage portal protein [Aerococcaceae bacterium 50-4]